MNKISVLISTYNAEKYIKQTLESIFNQTYINYEIIVIDNKSTDKTTEIIKKYKDKRLILKILDKNYGQTYALNYGLKYCNGEYIARIDSDDVALPFRFERQLYIIEKNNLDLLSTQVFYINDESKIIGKSNFYNFNNLSFYFILLSNPIAHPTTMFRKDFIIKENGYNERYKYWQDIEIWIKFLKKNNTFIANDYLTKIRIHKNQTSKIKDELISRTRKNELISLIDENINSNELPQKIKVLLLLKKNILIFLLDKKLRLFSNLIIYVLKNMKNIFFNKFFYIMIYIYLRKR